MLGRGVGGVVTNVSRSRGRLRRTALLATTALVTLGLALARSALPAAAQSATWLANPGSNDYNTPGNWDTGFLPAGINPAFFDVSNTTAVNVSIFTAIGGWTLNAGASNYTFTIASIAPTMFTGTGIVINGGSATVIVDGTLTFLSGTASSATITNNNEVNFSVNSTAGSSVITNDGTLRFNGIATAGTSTITNSAGRTTEFRDNSTAGNAQLINNGAGAVFDFSASAGPNDDNKLSAGSIAGNGTFNLGANELTVGGNNLSTTVSGVISGSGSLVKTGTGTLTLTGANTYTGATTVSAGVVDIQGSLASGSITNNASLGYSSSATARSAAITNNMFLDFWNTASAGSATITNSYILNFNGASTAGNAAIVNDGYVYFKQTSTADNAGITNNSLGTIEFRNSSNAGTGTTITNAGVIDFSGTAGQNNDNKVSAGSIAGSGTFSLGANELTVGSNFQSTVFSGTIADGGMSGGTGGSLVKTGAGTLTLSGANTYTGGTTVNAGTLEISGSIASGTVTNTATLTYAGSASAGSAAITNNGGGTLNFKQTSTAGGADITNSGNLNFDDTSTAGSATIISSSSDSGGIFLHFLSNSTAGSATIINGNNSYLNFYGDSTAGNASLTNNFYMYLSSSAASATVVNNNMLYFFGSGTGGSATITNNSGGTTFFLSNTTAGNAQLINNAANAVFDFSGSNGPNGDNKISAGSIAGNGMFSLGANELTVGGNNLSTSVSGVISGNGGALVKTGTGTMTLTGTNTYTGGTTINAGVLQFDQAASIGSSGASVTVNAGGTAAAGYAMDQAFLGRIADGSAGVVALAADSANNLDFNAAGLGNASLGAVGDITYSGTLSAAGGTYRLGGGGGTLRVSTALTGGNTLVVGANGTTAGTVVLTGANTYSGTTTVTGAVLQAGAANVFAANSAHIIGVAGTLNLGGFNQVIGSLAGAGLVHLGAATLTSGGDNSSTTFAGAIGGNGSLVKTGTGTMTLSGTNTYTGATTVNGGTLSVNGSILGSSGLTVNSGGTLGGTGIVGNTTINGGTLAPGNSIGTLTVQGNLTFNAGGVYTVEVSPTAADRTNVIGTATLTGATVNAVALPGSFRAQSYTILNATGGLGGTQFAGVTSSGSFAPARSPRLTYDANNVFLVLDPGTLQLPAGTGGNQSSVAGGINSAVTNGATPPPGFDVLLNMTDAPLIKALGQVSGQPGASNAQSGSAAAGQFVNAIFGNAFGGAGGTGGLGFAEAEENDAALAYAARPKVSRAAKEAYAAVTPRDRRTPLVEGRWGVFASVYGGNNRVGGDNAAGTNTTTSRTYGMLAGADYRFTRDTQAGFALGGAGSSFGIDGGFGGGKADIFNAAIYGKHTIGPAYIAGALGYSWQDTTTDRTVTVSGTDQLHASFKAQAVTARLEGGWRYATPIIGITPYAALQSTTFYMPAYGETATSGSNQFALSYASKTTTNFRTELGAKFDKSMLMQGGIFTLTGRAAWAHDSNVDSSATATFQSLPGATFTSNGAKPSPNGALLSLGADMAWHNGWSIAALLDGEFSRTTTAYSAKGQRQVRRGDEIGGGPVISHRTPFNISAGL